MQEIEIRSYTPRDHEQVKGLYEESGWFDPVTDAEERLKAKVEKMPDSILVAAEDSLVVGTVSLIYDERMALLFRLVTRNGEGRVIRQRLLEEGQSVLREWGAEEVHIIAPVEDNKLQQEYVERGFIRGNKYRWMWKNI